MSNAVLFYYFADTCRRHVKFATAREGYSLQGHVFKNLTLNLDTGNPCRRQCVMESRCVSVNIGPLINDNVICELSDSDHSLHPEDLKVRDDFAFVNMEVSEWSFV